MGGAGQRGRSRWGKTGRISIRTKAPRQQNEGKENKTKVER